MLTAPFSWAEEGGSTQKAAMSFANDGAAAPLTFRLAWSLLKEFIPYILGYAELTGTYSDWQLHRKTPARHPRFPGLRATKILSIQGEGPAGTDTAQSGYYSKWEKALVTVLFEALPYRVMEDSELPSPTAEYLRYATWSYEPNIETLARRGQSWWYVGDEAQAAGGQTYPGDLLLKQPKGHLQIVWYNVPEPWIYLGKLMPTNFVTSVGTVNSDWFPEYGYKDQNVNPLAEPQVQVKFAPGTLLMLPPKIEPVLQTHHYRVFAGVTESVPPTNDLFLGRSYNVTCRWQHFDPPFTPGGKRFVTLSTGKTVVIRGHNLVPVPRPHATTGGVWYAASSRESDKNLIFLPDDKGLLYQYTKHANVFSWPRSTSDVPP